MRKNILDLTHTKANAYFLKQDKYFSTELPEYYDFKNLIKAISGKMNGNTCTDREIEKAKKREKVNHYIFDNKDGKYAWRKMVLLNPYLYISLINTITEIDSWKIICERFKEIQDSKSINCLSIPIQPHKNEKQKAAQIMEWIEEFEKESVRLALDYEYLFQTDINGCYSSIYTHSISWALHNKSESKSTRGYSDLLGNKIDCHLQAMSYGQTNGIPQGSILMDFIAEIVLAYADSELLKKIKEDKRINNEEFYILRFRDDYRIFVRNLNQSDAIMRLLSETLADLGMSLNTSKTKRSEKVIRESIKSDKFHSLSHPQLKLIEYISLRNELLMIYKLGIEYPNSGSIIRRLIYVNENVKDKLLIKYKDEFISIIVNIAYDSPRTFPIAAALISRSIVTLNDEKRKEVLDKVLRKISLLPNSGILEIWLQRITIKYKQSYPYNEALCRIANGEKLTLFNTDWISNIKIKQIIDNAKIVDENRKNNLDQVISKAEIRTFNKLY